MTTQQTREHHRTCNICEAMCGLIITHTATDVVSIKPNPDDPLSRGHICPKAVALQDFRTDPDRVTTPMKKVNGAFVPIGWEEAFDLAVEGIQGVQERHGRESIGTYLGNPNAHKFGNLMTLPGLAKAIGSSNRYSSATADQVPHHIASMHMLGHPMLMPIPDLDRTDFILIIGANPMVSNGSMMTAPGWGRRLDELKARGGQAVVIDPRRTETAERAGAHHFIRPETDGFLLFAMIREVLEHGARLPEHLSDKIVGLDDLRATVDAFTPELAAEKTGISAETIRDLAQRFYEAPRAVCYARMGASTQSFGTICQWATNLLNLLTGNFDREGGAMFTTPAVDYVAMTSRKGRPRKFPEGLSRVSGKPAYLGEYPVSVMAEEMETPGEGQIKGLITIAGNPVLTAPNGRRIERAMEGLEFMVSIDIHVNDTTRHADLILPATVALEEPIYDMIFHSFAVRNTAAYARALFPTPNENPSEWEIIATLTQRLSGANSLEASPEQKLTHLLSLGNHPEAATVDALLTNPNGLDFGPLAPSLADRIEAPDGTIQLAPAMLVDDLQRLLAHRPADDPNHPLLMIGRRQVRSHNSWTQNSARLVKGRNRCTLQIHPDDAARLGIHDAQNVRVKARSGMLNMPAEVTDEIAPGVVSIPQGWGQRNGHLSAATKTQTVSINDLTDDQRIDPLSGNAAFNGVAVSVVPITS